MKKLLTILIVLTGCTTGPRLLSPSDADKSWYVQHVEFSDRAGHVYKVTLKSPGMQGERVAYMDSAVKVGTEIETVKAHPSLTPDPSPKGEGSE